MRGCPENEKNETKTLKKKEEIEGLRKKIKARGKLVLRESVNRIWIRSLALRGLTLANPKGKALCTNTWSVTELSIYYYDICTLHKRSPKLNCGPAPFAFRATRLLTPPGNTSSIVELSCKGISFPSLR